MRWSRISPTILGMIGGIVRETRLSIFPPLLLLSSGISHYSCILQDTAAGASNVIPLRPAAQDPCPQSWGSSGQGTQLALLVGVGRFTAANIPHLEGPPHDVQRIADFLHNQQYGFGFRSEEVCSLSNDQARLSTVTQRFDQLLKAARSNMQIVIFFSGHGTRIPDTNGDEPDDEDEALVLFDALVSDDWLHQRLRVLNELGARVTVVIDACNASSLAKIGLRTQPHVPGLRFLSPELAKAFPLAPSAAERTLADADAGFASTALENVVYLSAAQDGTSAIERKSAGVFTEALLGALTTGSPRMSYQQVAYAVQALVKQSGSAQVPEFGGNLNQVFLGRSRRDGRATWYVTAAKHPLATIQGLPWPGWSSGTQVLFYDRSARGVTLEHPTQAKAVGVIEHAEGIRATVTIPPTSPVIEPGDLVVQRTAGGARSRLAVHLQKIPPTERRTLRQALRSDEFLKNLSKPAQSTVGAYVVLLSASNEYELWDPSGLLRNQADSIDQLIHQLRNHARQIPLLNLQGEPGNLFINDHTLEVVFKKAGGDHRRLDASQLPICEPIDIYIKYNESSRTQQTLNVGGVFLGNDGAIESFPTADLGNMITLVPGEQKLIKHMPMGIVSPTGPANYMLVIGLLKDSEFPWSLLTKSGLDQESSPTTKPLANFLNRYLRGNKTSGIAPFLKDNPAWTTSKVVFQALVNPRFIDAPGSQIRPREYILSGYNIYPWLPASRHSALARVLRRADALARKSIADGLGYSHHRWPRRHERFTISDEQNLTKGIDCSRAIWYAFTRADGYREGYPKGIPYTRGQRYYPTAKMVEKNAPLAKHFDRCDHQPLQTGDVLVYRGTDGEYGHTVMVIDPIGRVAWGAHGFDGNRIGRRGQGDIAVEYQRIPTKQSGQKWDSPNMERVACWRHKAFIKEREQSMTNPRPVFGTNYCENHKPW